MFDPLRLSSAAIVRSSSAEFEILKIVLRVSVADAVPRQLHSAEDVEVQVHHLLPAVFAAVANKSVSALIKPHFASYFLDKSAHFAHHFRRCYLKVFVAFLRDRQDMDRRFWVDVVEGQKFIVL